MTDTEIIEMISSRGIRPTANRILVARALASAGRPLSLNELEELMESVDKSGIFRSLMAFKDGKLLHVIEDGGNGVRYELCHAHSEGSDDDGHAHFFCVKCHRSFCLNEVHSPDILLPEGFSKMSVNIVVKGICSDCSD